MTNWPCQVSFYYHKFQLHPISHPPSFSPSIFSPLHLKTSSSMKSQPIEFSLGRNSYQKIPKIILLLPLTLLLLTIIPFYYPIQKTTTPSLTKNSPISESATIHRSDADSIKITEHEKCDIFSGEWVPNPEAPYYTNTTCWAIHEHQNCMKYGRPDSEFMKWRWKPDGCDLPIFNPYQFLEIVRGKSMAFVGDSVGRNQMQSLMCMLSRVRIYNLI